MRKLSGRVFVVLVMFFAAFASAMAADTASTSEAKPHDILENIKFRNLGPAVGGGRVTSVVGIPGQPNIYYAGAAAGGVFKTIDGGLSWKAIFEKEPVGVDRRHRASAFQSQPHLGGHGRSEHPQ